MIRVLKEHSACENNRLAALCRPPQISIIKFQDLDLVSPTLPPSDGLKFYHDFESAQASLPVGRVSTSFTPQFSPLLPSLVTVSLPQDRLVGWSECALRCLHVANAQTGAC
jgi:hypothetical protein